jgi:putative hydrolase of the HAD superfamily
MSSADLFFDLDRTLWDFDRNSREALAEIFHEIAQSRLRISIGEQQFIAVYEVENERCWNAYRKGELTQSELRPLRFQRSLEALGVEHSHELEQVSAEMGQAYVERAPYRTALIPGAMEVCETLKRRGHRMFILTNGFDEVQHIKMKNSGLSPFFDQVFTSDALGHKKPALDAFQACLNQTGSNSSRAIMIGDDLECDVNGARLAGWRQVHYDPSEAPSDPNLWQRIRRLDELLNLELNCIES